MNITIDNFQDYGIVDWFDQSKGFGVVQSVRNGEVFIHKKHGISGEVGERKIALIRSVSIDAYRNTRVYGNDVQVWNGEEDLYEVIYNKFIKTTKTPSLLDIKWLINHGPININTALINVIDVNLEQHNELFKDIANNRRRLKGVFDTLLFEKWVEKGEFKYDIYLETLFRPLTSSSQNYVHQSTVLHLDPKFIEKILNIDYNWIFDPKFSNIFRLLDKTKKIICAFLMDEYIKNKNKTDYVAWAFKYGGSSIVKDLIANPNLANDATLAELIIGGNSWGPFCDAGNYILKYWKSKEQKNFDSYIIWLLKYANDETLAEIVNANKDHWVNDLAFIEAIKNLAYLPTTLSFIQEVCCMKRVVDANFDWLIEFADIDAIKQVISHFTGYKLEVLEAIHLALFPNNNKNFFIEKARTKNWTSDFEWSYNSDQQKRIKNLFIDLFKTQLRITPSDAPVKDILKKQTHSATDLASFTFCPVSYVLAQTYDLNFSEQENIYVGQKEHDKKRLLNIGTIVISPSYPRITKNETFGQLVSRIRSSDCLFNGHGNKLEKPFYSKNKKLSSIPDYVFQDKNGIFIVEEKYTFKKPEQVKNLYDNHKIQALTYLYGLEDFKPSAAYVCYWFIEKEDDNYKILEAKAFGLVKSDENKQTLLKAYYYVEALQNRESLPFSPHQINHSKCVRCNYFPYCDYKAGNKTSLYLPSLPIDAGK